MATSSLTTDPAEVMALRVAYDELFLIAGRLRRGDLGMERLAALRSTCESMLQAARQRLRLAHLDEQLIADAELAVVALLDESAQLSNSRESAELWLATSLQSKLYGHTHLGHHFFRRLDQRRQQPATPLPLLELYGRALRFGFAGRYREQGRLDELAAIEESLRSELRHRRGVFVSLAAQLVPARPAPPAAPLLASYAIFAIGGSLLLLFWFGLYGLLFWRAEDAARQLRHAAAMATANLSTHTPGQP